MYQHLFVELFEQHPLPWLHCDPAGIIIAANPAACALWGGRKLLEQPLQHVCVAETLQAHVQTSATAPDVWHGEVVCMAANNAPMMLTLKRFAEAWLAKLEPLPLPSPSSPASSEPVAPSDLSANLFANQGVTDAPVTDLSTDAFMSTPVPISAPTFAPTFAPVSAPMMSSEALHRAVEGEFRIDATSVFVIEVDRHWRFSYVNDATMRIRKRGQPRNAELLLGKSLWDVLPHLGEADNAFGQAYRYAMAHRQPVFVEGRTRDSDFKDLWLRTYAVPTDKGLLIHGLDGSEQKHLEQSLASALADRDNVLNSITDNFVVLNNDWRFVYANQQVLEKLSPEIIGKHYFEVFPHNRGTIFERAYQKAFETRQPSQFEARLSVGNRWAEVRVYPHHDGIAIFSSDIHERKQLEEQLEQAITDKENILNSITDSVIVLNRQWRFVYANNNALRSHLSLVGKHYFEVFPHNRGSVFEHYYQHVFDTGEGVRFTAKMTKSGIWAEVRVFPSPEGIAIYIADISELKEKEAALEHALASQEMLLKEVHHRTKNNMQLIASMLSIQAHSLKDERSRRAIIASRDRINVLADVHKLMYQQLDSETINTEAHLRGLLQKLARAMTEREVTVDIDIAALDVTIHQAIPLGLIVNELFTNALKHAFGTPSQSDVIAVRLWLEQDQIVLEVADNGVGLPADVASQQDSLGMTIITSLVGQLAGEWSLANGDTAGTVARVQFAKDA